MMRTHTIAGICVATLVACMPAISAGPNLLENPGFEQTAEGRPVAWETPAPETLGAANAIDTETTRSGDVALRLTRESAEGWGYWSQGPIDVVPGQVYDLGGWIRMQDVVRPSYPGVFFLLHVMDEDGEVIQKAQTPYLGGTEDWQRWNATFTMHEDAAEVIVYLEHARATGTAWFDDVYLRVSDAEPMVDEPGLMPTRAIWVSKSHFNTPEAADAFIAQAKACNINVLLPNVYGHGSVMYESDEFDMPDSVPEDFDPLAYIIERAHAEGMEVHPWFNVVRGPLQHLDEDRLWMFYWSAERDRWFGGWADVHRPEFRDWIVELMLDCCERYDVDGLHYDYIRAGVDCACEQCVAEFEAQFGHGMDEATNTEWAQWHQPAVTDIVHRATLGLREIKPDAITSAAVQSHYAGPRGGQDGPGWVREGILDVLMP
ncbi:MAG: family 10 glycosylhydrolase, partial [Armatimonadia bacterium]|nr:family 10 glycosylhydrolase [Armatimonadia bacterium]